MKRSWLIRSYILLEILQFLIIIISGVLWAAFSFGFFDLYLLDMYETRAIVLLSLFINFIFWEITRLYYTLNKRIIKFSIYLLFLFQVMTFVIFLLFDVRWYSYFFLLIFILLGIILTRSYYFLLLLPIIIFPEDLQAFYISVLAILISLDMLLLDHGIKTLVLLSLPFIVTFYLFSPILSQIFTLIFISFIIFLVYKKERIFVNRLFIMLLLFLLLSALSGNAVVPSLEMAIFHVLFTSSQAVSLLIYLVVIGRRGWIKFKKGYSKIINIIHLGLALSITNYICIFFPMYFPIAFYLMVLFGIFFSIALLKAYRNVGG